MRAVNNRPYGVVRRTPPVGAVLRAALWSEKDGSQGRRTAPPLRQRLFGRNVGTRERRFPVGAIFNRPPVQRSVFIRCAGHPPMRAVKNRPYSVDRRNPRRGRPAGGPEARKGRQPRAVRSTAPTAAFVWQECWCPGAAFYSRGDFQSPASTAFRFYQVRRSSTNAGG